MLLSSSGSPDFAEGETPYPCIVDARSSIKLDSELVLLFSGILSYSDCLCPVFPVIIERVALPTVSNTRLT